MDDLFSPIGKKIIYLFLTRFFSHNISKTDGFFDAGMLLQALKNSQEEKERPSEKAVVNARRAIGKKLRLSEY